MSNQTVRVLELIKRFNNGQKVCIEILKYDTLWYGKSEKTIRRDLNIVKEFFPNSFNVIYGEKGCYKAITKEIFNRFLDERTLLLLIQTFNIIQQNELFKTLNIEEIDKKVIKSKLNETKKIYIFKSKPLEFRVYNYELIEKLEHAIYHQKIITINYPTRNGIREYEVKPYKILFINENFYLACEVDNLNFSFSLYRISKIENIKVTSKKFYKDIEIEEFIDSIQTPFAKYKRGFRKDLIDVVVEVDRVKAFYFKSKKFLNSQKIIKTKKNGNLLISYKITQELEIEELIKRWLPHIVVIKPLSLKNKIENDLKNYLKEL